MSATHKARPDADGPREADNYPTPAWAVEAIVPHVIAAIPSHHPRPIIYDPGCGGGAILRAFSGCGCLDYSGRVLQLGGCDIRPEAVEACREFGATLRDWLDYGPPFGGPGGLWPSAIVMNPPYGGRQNIAQRFVAAAMARVASSGSVWALLRVNWLIDGQSTHGRGTWIRDGPGLPDVYALSRRPSFTGDGKADATTYAWMHWRDGDVHSVSDFRLLDCGKEQRT